jgi:hypothetical protein
MDFIHREQGSGGVWKESVLISSEFVTCGRRRFSRSWFSFPSVSSPVASYMCVLPVHCRVLLMDEYGMRRTVQLSVSSSPYVALLLTVVGLLCIELLSYVYFCYLMCIVLLCVYCCLTSCSCRIAGWKSVSGRYCDRPPRHRFFLVSLCLKVNSEVVPKTPSCYCVLLM